MRIFDENNNPIETYDSDRGYLIEDSIFIAHHEATEAIPEKGHWVVIAEYPNGGKDVDWIVDEPGVEAREAWDEYESILRYIAYSDEELAARKAAEEEARKNSVEYRITEIEAMLNALLGVT